MLRKQMVRNKIQKNVVSVGKHDNLAVTSQGNNLKGWRFLSRLNRQPVQGYIITKELTFTVSPGFLRLAKVEYDAKFKAALRDKLPAEVVDEIAETVLGRLEGEYWRQ